MASKVSSKGILFQNKCELVLDEEISAIYDALNPPESPLWHQFGVGHGNQTAVVVFPEESNGRYTEVELKAFFDDCSRLKSAGYSIQQANFGRSEGFMALFVSPRCLISVGESEPCIFTRAQQVLQNGATELWDNVREVDSRILEFSHNPIDEIESDFLDASLKALQNAGWIVDARVEGDMVTCKIMAPLFD
ncbi:hypothetical protein ACXZ66_11585 [Corynebacterium sp. S7]